MAGAIQGTFIIFREFVDADNEIDFRVTIKDRRDAVAVSINIDNFSGFGKAIYRRDIERSSIGG